MTTQLENAMASLRSALPDDSDDHGHVLVESDAVREVLAALYTPPADDVRACATHGMAHPPVHHWECHFDGSNPQDPPPADDVREALDHLDVMNESGRIAYADYVALHDMVSRIEVRPRGTVTENAREAEMRELHHFEVEQQLAETIAIVKRAQAAVLRHEHTPASLHMDEILNEVNTEIPSESSVRPHETVTDAEALRLGKVAWIAHQDDKSWAASVVEDCFSPADDLPEEALDMIAVARAVLEAAREVRPRGTVTPPADDVRRLLDELAQYASDSIGAQYGTLSASLVAGYVEKIKSALSTLPADDVREALTRSLTGGERLTPDEAMQHAYANAVTRAPGRMTWGEALRHFATWMREHDARLVAEVRPRGTVTENTREAEMRELHHFEVEQQLAETIAIVKRAQAAVLRHEHTPASLHMDEILNEVNTEIPSESSVRPHETVTDAATKWEYVPGEIWTDRLGDTHVAVQNGFIAPDYVSAYIAEGGDVLRRKVGPWETVTEESGS